MVMQTGTTKLADKRADARKQAKSSAILHYKGTQIPVVLRDISRSGARVALNPGRSNFAFEGTAQLEVPGFAKIPFDIRWRTSTLLGGAFDVPQTRKAVFKPQIDRLLTRLGR